MTGTGEGRARSRELRSASVVRAWTRRHAYSLLASIGQIVRHPVATAMTVCVLAIALSLPLGLHILLENLRAAALGLERMDTLSAFLNVGLEQSDAERLAAKISGWPEVLAADPVDPDTGLDELAASVGLGTLDLSFNPLPWMLEVVPLSGIDALALAERIAAIEEIDSVLVDQLWLDRFEALLALIGRFVTLLAVLLALGVLLGIATNIRAEVESRHEEIEVMALVGGSAGYIRRPFLYAGLWMGLLSALTAWLVLLMALRVLSGPALDLARSYAADFELLGPTPGLIATMLVGSGLLGIAGAWLAVARRLRAINP